MESRHLDDDVTNYSGKQKREKPKFYLPLSEKMKERTEGCIDGW